MLGYWVETPACGRGVASRSVAQALSWARADPRIQVVWAMVAEGNAASRRVVEKHGFSIAGRRPLDERGDVPLIYETSLRRPPAV
jgi:RimJ/RimL family protein N-acetyltransferase